MCVMLRLAAVTVVFLWCAAGGHAQKEGLEGTKGSGQAPEKWRPIIERAVEAHGGKENLAKRNKVRILFERTLPFVDLGGRRDPLEHKLESKVEMVAHLPDKLKIDCRTAVTFKAGVGLVRQDWSRMTLVLNGDEGSQRSKQTWPVDNPFKEVNKKLGEEERKVLQGEARFYHVTSLVPLLSDSSYKKRFLGDEEVKIRGKTVAAVGVQVERKGMKPITLYFDKDTGLLVKSEHEAWDAEKSLMKPGASVQEEWYYTDYQKMQGMQVAKQISVYRDGKPHSPIKVTKVQCLESVDDEDFQVGEP